jgi:hypothetical protein
MATTRSVLLALKAAVQAADGTGSYVYDLSGTDTVILGEISDAYKLPQVLIFVDNVTIEPFELTTERMRLRVRAVGFVGDGTDTAEGRLLAAADLQQDILRATRADRSLGGTVIDMQREGSAYVAESETGDLFGVADVTITVQWFEVAA